VWAAIVRRHPDIPAAVVVVLRQDGPEIEREKRLS
jgi:hypothetical protein